MILNHLVIYTVTNVISYHLYLMIELNQFKKLNNQIESK